MKSTPTLKPMPSIAPPVESAPTEAPQQRTVAAEARRPRRATGRVPEAARSSRPKRTPEQLLEQARTATADWPDTHITAEGIRRTVRTSPANARMLRDTLLAERGIEGGPSEGAA
ncbi:hypothetical protein [Streptomyces boninensis]|uniref:hypothetical protein n=1 Tax=Streptomyces boninensis TaxID=2039455 RepID=UPI003B222EB3